ncbi:hypothetical protein FBUS_01072 [Fasciolopsis buskii]|uniref:Uncharacterized protein n=1 Tax=Fasciolopsis buskii TaxID=27845 RepID=A0A8E0RZU4_9TREM|nr:hypothetical protein FBUS_01072 [Fasciolopsis buski]
MKYAMPKNQLHYDQIQNLLCDATEVAHRLEYHDANVLKFQCLFELRNFLNDISDKADIFSSILHVKEKSIWIFAWYCSYLSVLMTEPITTLKISGFLFWLHCYLHSNFRFKQVHYLRKTTWLDVLTMKYLSFCGLDDASESHLPLRVCQMPVIVFNRFPLISKALARNSVIRLAEISQLEIRHGRSINETLAAQIRLSTMQISTLIFKRAVIESRRRPPGNMRPKVRIDFATLLTNKWPRTQTERYLNQLFPHPAVQVLAILETLTLPPGKRRSLIKPSTPADENDWELNDVYTELLMAALELIYPQSSVKLSSSYEPGGKRGRPVSSAELIGLEQNNRIVPLHNETVAKWTQTKFVTMLYSSRLEGMDEESTKAWSCTWDSLMKLIEIAFAMAQYDVFLALTVPTIKLLQEFLDNETEQNSNQKMAKSHLRTLHLMRAMYLFQREQRQSQSAKEVPEKVVQDDRTKKPTEDIVQLPTVPSMFGKLNGNHDLVNQWLPKHVNNITQVLKQTVSDGSLPVRFYNAGVILDAIWILWDQGRISLSKLLTEYHPIEEISPAPIWCKQLIAHIYVFRLIQCTFIWLDVPVFDGLLVAHWNSLLLTAVHELHTYETQQLRQGRSNLDISTHLLNALRMETETEMNISKKCYVSLWISVWTEISSSQRWVRKVIASRMEQLSLKLFNHKQQKLETEYRELSELLVDLIWLEQDVAHRLFLLESQVLRDTIKEDMKQELARSSMRLFSKSLSRCRRNPVARAFLYCHHALDDPNSEKTSKFLQNAEEIIQNSTSDNGAHSTGSLHQIMLPDRVRLERQQPDSREDRPPPPMIISRSCGSIVLETKNWRPKNGESVSQLPKKC